MSGNDDGGSDPPPPPPVPSDYKGSQAFSHIITTEDESINPNTGSLNFAAPLFELRGVVPSVDLTVRLWYSEGNPGTFGLPKDWGLDLPFLVFGTSETSITVDSRTYLVDKEWVDSTGYKSGLRYINNKGMLFSSEKGKLPSGRGDYSYSLKHPDGSTDYFNDKGMPIEHDDIHGNFIQYAFNSNATSGPRDGKNAQLVSITDSWGQTIKFTYTDSKGFQATLPDGNFVTVEYDANSVTAVTDAAKQRTTFTYAKFDNDNNVLSTITYPSGVVSSFVYTGLDFITSAGAKSKLPAVADHVSRDTKGVIVRHFNYAYGTLTKGTYTGASIGLRWIDKGDALMDGSTDEVLKYIYDVVRTSLDGMNKPLAKTYSYFNHLHLPIAETRLVQSTPGSFIESFKNTFTYKLDKQAQTPMYSRPIIVEMSHNITPGSAPTYQALKRTTSTYNDYGNATLIQDEIHDPNKSFIVQRKTENAFATTPMKTQILTRAAVTDAIQQAVYITVNTLTADQKDIASTTLSYSLGQQDPLPWKNRVFTYDDKGRNTSQVLSWSAGAPIPNDTIPSVTYKTEYNFAAGKLTQKEVDPTSAVTVMEFDVSMNTGPMMTKTLPLGQTDIFEYDAVGRLTKHVDALKNQTKTEYSVSATNGNWEKKTTPNGYIVLKTFDVLGRITSEQDNGDITQSPNNVNRTVSTKSYDSLSHIVQSTDKYMQTTSYSYDALGRPLSITDSQKNMLTYTYDDTALTITQALNGDRRALEVLNGQMQVTSMVKYPDSSDKTIDYALIELSKYDGEGRIVTKTLQRTPLAGGAATMLQNESVTYGPESAVTLRVAEGVGDIGKDRVTRQYTRDLFGNVFTYVKTMLYANGAKYEHPGPKNFYDANNRLTSTTNQLGGSEKWEYDANGWLQHSVQLDGAKTSYTYDNIGHLLSTTYPTPATTSYGYDYDGHMVKVQDSTGLIEYKYALDGSLLSTTYPDQKVQQYELDKFSRVIKETDVFGMEKKTVFNAFGDVVTASCEKDVVTYAYGNANHTNGMLVGSTLAGHRSYNTSLMYDGFGRLSARNVVDPQNQALLATIYLSDETGKIKQYESVSQNVQELNETRQFQYDGMNQVIVDTRIPKGKNSQQTRFAYDGNSNLISITDPNGKITKMRYNEIDQRSKDDGFVYDDRGRLVSDNTGQKYEFDDQDRLKTVHPKPDQGTTLKYYANDFLSDFERGTDAAKIYYNIEKINAMRTTDKQQQQHQTSYFRESDSLISSYTDKQPHTYFLDRLGSTALTMDLQTNASITYSTYGTATTTTPLELDDCFGFKQEFFDSSTNLVYLRSRYYNTELGAFISMDTYRQENRYTFCKGDPINLIDPSGHFSWKKMLGMAVGALVGAVVTMGVGALVGAALGAIGASAVTASIASTVIGGAVGSVASGAATAFVQGEGYSAKQALTDAFLGAVGSAVSKGVGSQVGKLFANSTAKKFASMAAGGMASYASKKVLKPLVTGKTVTAAEIASSAMIGAAMGAAAAESSDGGQVDILSPQALAMLYNVATGIGMQVHMSLQSSPEDAAYQPLELDEKAFSAAENSSSAMASGALDSAFSTSSNWAPSSMSDIIKRSNNAFGGQWQEWTKGAGGSKEPMLTAR